MADPTELQSASLTAATPPATPPAVDIQAEISTALAMQQAEFAAQLKAATGHDNLKALADANLKAQGKLQELADSRLQEAQTYKARFEQAAISSAILAASLADAIDTETVAELLTSKAAVDEHGRVTIDGKPAAEAVRQLLIDKPFLAKTHSGTGSGAPQQTATSAKNPWLPAQFNLTEQVNISKTNPALAAQLKAAAGK